MDHRESGGVVEYKVHWANYPSSQDTWEPESNLKHCQEFIQEYIMGSLAAPVKYSSCIHSFTMATACTGAIYATH